DLASTIIFASFALFSIINIVIVNGRGPYEAPAAVSPIWDLAVIAIGLALYAILFYFHGSITGMPLL
ncbi:MAG: putative membrane protein, partial [Candidatus Azotimanducaceae bacterium]